MGSSSAACERTNSSTIALGGILSSLFALSDNHSTSPRSQEQLVGPTSRRDGLMKPGIWMNCISTAHVGPARSLHRTSRIDNYAPITSGSCSLGRYSICRWPTPPLPVEQVVEKIAEDVRMRRENMLERRSRSSDRRRPRLRATCARGGTQVRLVNTYASRRPPPRRPRAALTDRGCRDLRGSPSCRRRRHYGAGSRRRWWRESRNWGGRTGSAS